MDRISIGINKPQGLGRNVFFVELSQATDLIGILRSDYFNSCEINVDKEINNSQLKFLMHLGRVLSTEGTVIATGAKQNIQKIKTILSNLGFYAQKETDTQVCFSKRLNEPKVGEQKVYKLAIGFKSLEEQQIDEQELLKNQEIDLSKTGKDCGEKARACANCNCGRKNNQALPSKAELVQSVNEGNPVSGCGKCYLGDSFRCSTCPYQGLPAFKPGDKLKLVDETKVIVENTTAKVTNGKVKIQL